MSHSKLRWMLTIAALCAIPFAFNACQGQSLLGSKGFSAASSCAVEKGIVVKLAEPSAVPPGFLDGKVKLRADLAGTPMAKASNLDLRSGKTLSVIINNSCLQNSQDQIPSTVISQMAAKSGQMINSLDRQAYEWILERDYSEAEINEIANRESCVMGVSWNQTYKLQTAYNDTSKVYQTHLPAINAELAYDYFFKSGGSGGGMAATGTPVVVAVVDTGVDYQHPDLAANMWVHSTGVGIDITTLGTSTINYYPNDISGIGHGTHVAGAIAAVANNSIGVVGAMPFRAKIMAIRLFRTDPATGELSTTSQHFYNALRFAYLNGANVINLSIGSITSGPNTDSVAASAVSEAVSNKVVVITVIGNADNGGNGAEVNGTTLSSIPGQYSTQAGVIGVGSFDAQSGAKSYFSHFSTTYAEIGAPGAEQGATGIYSTLPTSLSSYGRLAGTSQAAPLVSAAAALTIGLIRDATGVAPSPAEVERLLLASATKSTQLNTFFKEGNRLDLLKLVRKINADYPATLSGNGGAVSSLNCR